MDLTPEQYSQYVKSLKHPNLQEIRKRIKEPISETDIYNYLGYDFSVKEDVITYSQLSEFTSIEQVLEHDKAWKIVLIEDEVNSGHWVLLLRYGKTIEFYNSYGTKPSYELDLISDEVNEQLGQEEKYLNKLLLLAKDKYKVIYNKKRFQKLADGINTCGRWCLLRIIMLKHFNLDLSKFIKFMDYLKKKYNMTFDEIVSLIII